MPPINHPILASGALVVVSLAAAAAIAVYENPEVREWADQCRRRIAEAFQGFADDFNPNARFQQEPRFNRPEDAEGFMMSSADASNNSGGVDADEESKRRQREELMYWNSIRLEKLSKDKKESPATGAAAATAAPSTGQESGEKPRASPTTFDEFLHEDTSSSEKGAYVYNTGTDVRPTAYEEGLRRRGGGASEGLRGLERGTRFGNPFADEHDIDIYEDDADDNTYRPAPVAAAPLTFRSPAPTEDLYTADDLKQQQQQQQQQQALRRPTAAASASSVSGVQTDASSAASSVAAQQPPPLLINFADPPISVPSVSEDGEVISLYESAAGGGGGGGGEQYHDNDGHRHYYQHEADGDANQQQQQQQQQARLHYLQTSLPVPASAFESIQAWADHSAAQTQTQTQTRARTPPTTRRSTAASVGRDGAAGVASTASAEGKAEEAQPAAAAGGSAAFYSPLPHTPRSERSRAGGGSIMRLGGDYEELDSDGMATPTEEDSMSMVGRSEADEAGMSGREADVISDVDSDEEVRGRLGAGVATPSSWTEAGSVVSEL